MRPLYILFANKFGPRELLYGEPSSFLEPFLQHGRAIAHIDEIEFLAEAACAMFRVRDTENLVLFGITDISRSNIWPTPRG